MVGHIGIFWGISGKGRGIELLVDLVPVDQGEHYGDFLTYGGHHEFWEHLVAVGPQGLKSMNLPDVPLWSEYEEWPRGRVVFNEVTARFVIYADRKLQTAKQVEEIADKFSLPLGSYDVRSDAHYVSIR